MFDNCGVCNERVNLADACVMRKEDDGKLTVYHGECEGKAARTKACVDCGHHRRLCTECAEVAE